MRLRTLSALFLLAALLTWLPLASAAAQHRIGMAAIVTAVAKDDVSGVVAKEAPKPVDTGEDVFADERVITTGTGKLVIEFRDRTTLELGPKATVVIDQSVFNPVEGFSEKSVTIAAGAFRLISGVAVKNSKTEIRTAEGTLGIRGSIVIGEVTPQGTAIVAVEGQATWTNGLGTQNVPLMGAVVARNGTGQAAIVSQGPAISAITQQVSGQVGAQPPSLPSFSSAQMNQNGQDHVIPANQQGAQQQGPAANTQGNYLDTAGALLAKGDTSTAPPSPDNPADPVALVLTLATNPQTANTPEFYTAVYTMLSVQSSNQPLAIAAVVQELGGNAPPGQVTQVAQNLTAASPTLIAQTAPTVGAPTNTDTAGPPPPTLPTLPPPPLPPSTPASPI